MHILKSALALFIAAILFAGCNKDETPEPNTGEEKPLLKSIEFKDFNTTGAYTYHPDSTLQKIDYTGTTVSTSTNFEYNNKDISKISVSNSIYSSSYKYTEGKISMILMSEFGFEKRGHKLVFSYNQNGTVAQLKYYNMTEGVADKLMYTSTYTYASSGLLDKIVSVGDNSKITWTINSYSDPCNFIPWTFVNTSLTELYELYNYPVINQMKKLPSKITQTTEINGGTASVQKVIDIAYTITSKRIDKSVTTITYPANPGYNSRSEVLYHY